MFSHLSKSKFIFCEESIQILAKNIFLRFKRFISRTLGSLLSRCRWTTSLPQARLDMAKMVDMSSEERHNYIKILEHKNKNYIRSIMKEVMVTLFPWWMKRKIECGKHHFLRGRHFERRRQLKARRRRRHYRCHLARHKAQHRSLPEHQQTLHERLRSMGSRIANAIKRLFICGAL